MYHGTEENIRAKKKIIDALFALMEKKPFSEITVTDIITEADVARATYYRNFENKEAIIDSFIQNLYEEVMVQSGDYDIQEALSYDNVVRGFEKTFSCMIDNKTYMLALYQNGFGSQILETFNRYIEEFIGEMPHNSKERYLLYYIAGAASNVLVKWLMDGAVETPHEIAVTCADIMSRPIIN